MFVDLGGAKNLVALLAHRDKTLDLDAINYVALRAYGEAGGQRVSFNQMSAMTGVVPVTGALIPLLATFGDPADPASMRSVAPDDLEAGSGRAIACIASPPRWCRTASGRSISAVRWASPSPAASTAKLPWLDRGRRRRDGAEGGRLDRRRADRRPRGIHAQIALATLRFLQGRGV